MSGVRNSTNLLLVKLVSSTTSNTAEMEWMISSKTVWYSLRSAPELTSLNIFSSAVVLESEAAFVVFGTGAPNLNSLNTFSTLDDAINCLKTLTQVQNEVNTKQF